MTEADEADLIEQQQPVVLGDDDAEQVRGVVDVPATDADVLEQGAQVADADDEYPVAQDREDDRA